MMRSLLFVPGDSERKMLKAAGSGADALILPGARQGRPASTFRAADAQRRIFSPGTSTPSGPAISAMESYSSSSA